MTEIPFSGHLKLTNSFNQMKNMHESTLQINAEWRLACFWSEIMYEYRPKYLEIRRNSTAEEILISGTFQLMTDGNCILQRKFVHLIEAGLSTTSEMRLEYSKVPTGNRIYSISGTLTIPAYPPDKDIAKGIQFKSLLDLSKSFECLLDSNSAYFSDVNVNCGAVSFPAHKNILCARSPVFAAMFTTQMKENRDNKVNITDLSPHVLKTMLTYIYSGKTGELTVESAGELLFAADKYQLEDLKRVCCDYLKSCISLENVLRSLVLGDLHDQDLKLFAIDFICNSCEEFEVLEKTAEWKSLREKRPSLAMDVLTGLVISNNKKLKLVKGK